MSPEEAVEKYRSNSNHNGGKEEILAAIFEDKNGQCSGYLKLGSGEGSVTFTLDRLFVRICESGEGFWLVHNHPNGILKPSSYDKQTDKALEKIAGCTGVCYRGSLIVSKEAWARVGGESTRTLASIDR